MLVAQHQGDRELEATLVAFASVNGRDYGRHGHTNGYDNGYDNGSKNGSNNGIAETGGSPKSTMRLCEAVANIMVHDHDRGVAMEHCNSTRENSNFSKII